MVETFYSIPNAPYLALLSDLHNRPFQPVVRSLEKNKPSLICICGDVLYGSMFEENTSPLELQAYVLPFLYFCSTIAPTYLSLGNHEWMLDEADFETIRNTGVSVLDNSWVSLSVDGRTIVLGGLTSGNCLAYRRYLATLDTYERAKCRYPRKEKKTPHDPEIGWLTEFASTPGYHICLCHQPEYFPLIPEKVELVLSGHVHGGQWAYYSLRRKRMCGLWANGFFPKWTKGVYEKNRLIVSAGLSNTARVPRILNPTEVVFLRSSPIKPDHPHT